MENTNRAEQLTINGITYNVVAVDTVDAMAARGLERLAAMFRAEGRTRQLVLQRPRGRAQYLGIEWTAPSGCTWYRVVPMGGR